MAFECCARRKLLLYVAVVAVLFTPFSFPSKASAAIPRYLNFQGKLTDASDNPLSGSYSFTAKIYDAETGGNLTWSETQTVTVTNGIFNMVLGTSTSLASVDFNSPYWFTLVVAGEELSPRQRLTSAAYALNADTLDGLDSTKFVRSDASTTTSGALILSSYIDIDYSGTTAALSVNQQGTGTIAEFLDNGTAVFRMADGGIITLWSGARIDDTGGTYLEIRPATGDYLRIGDAGATSHSLNANDDALVTGKLEVDGTTYLDGNLELAGTITTTGTQTQSGPLVITSYIDLDYTGTAANAVDINLNPTGGTKDALSVTYGSGGGTGAGLIVNQQGSGAVATFQGSGTTIMQIPSASYVRIASTGTSSQSLTSTNDLYVQGKLEVDGAAYLDSTLTVASTLTQTGVLDLNNYLDLDYNGATDAINVRQDGSGNVAVFTDGANNALKIDGSSDVTVGTGSLSQTSASADLYVTGNIESGGTIFGNLSSTSGTTSVANLTVTGTANLQGTVENTDSGESIVLNDDVTIGKSSASTVTLNSASVTVANDTDLTLSGGVNGLSFDGTTFSVDATGNRIGIGTAGPAVALDVGGGTWDSGGAGAGDVLVSDDLEVDDDVRIDGGTVTLSAATSVDLANSQAQALNIEAGLLNLDTTNTRVGIGTTAPAARLNVTGADGTSALTVTQTGTGDIARFQDNGGTPVLTLQRGSYVKVANAGTTSEGLNATTDLYVQGNLEVDGWTYLDGGVYLGDTSTDDITVKGTGTFQQTTTMSGVLDLNNYLDLDYSGATDALNVTQTGSGDVAEFVRGSTTALRIDNSADVRIGAPSAGNTSTAPDLIVQGNLEVDGVTYLDGKAEMAADVRIGDDAWANTTGNADLLVDGNVIVGGTVVGNIDITSGSSVFANIRVTGTSDLRGNIVNTSATGTLAFDSNATFTGDVLVNTSGANELTSVTSTDARESVAISTNPSQVGGGAGADADGLIKLGVQEGAWEYIHYDASLGSAGKFSFSAPLQIAGASPASITFDDGTTTKTLTFNSGATEAFAFNDEVRVTDLVIAGASPAGITFGTGANMQTFSFDAAAGNKFAFSGGVFAQQFRNLVKNGSFEAFSALETFTESGITATGGAGGAGSTYHGGWSNFAPDEWIWKSGSIYQNAPVLFTPDTIITATTLQQEYYHGKSAVTLEDTNTVTANTYNDLITNYGTADAHLEQTITGLKPSTVYSVGAYMMHLSGTADAIVDISGEDTTTQTTLSVAINASVASISVASVANFPDNGILLIENERISYAGKDATNNKFTLCIRGFEGTTANQHAINIPVKIAPFKHLTTSGSATAGQFTLYKGQFVTTSKADDVIMHIISTATAAGSQCRLDAVQIVEGRSVPEFQPSAVIDTGDQTIYGSLRMGRTSDERGGILSVDKSIRTRAIEFFGKDPGMSGTVGGFGMLGSAVKVGGTGSITLTTTGTYFGANPRDIRVTITGASPPMFQWEYREIFPGSGYTATYITGGTGLSVSGYTTAAELPGSMGVKVAFGATASLSTDDAWTFTASGMDMHAQYNSFSATSTYQPGQTRIYKDTFTQRLMFQDGSTIASLQDIVGSGTSTPARVDYPVFFPASTGGGSIWLSTSQGYTGANTVTFDVQITADGTSPGTDQFRWRDNIMNGTNATLLDWDISSTAIPAGGGPYTVGSYGFTITFNSPAGTLRDGAVGDHWEIKAYPQSTITTVKTLVGGSGITSSGTGDSRTIDFAPTEMNSLTWGDGSQASFTHTYNVSMGTDPILTFGGGSVGVNTDVSVGTGTFDNTSASTDLYVTGNLEVDGTVYADVKAPTGGRSRFVNITVTGTADLQGTIENSAGTLSFNDDAMAISKAATLDLTNSEARALNIEAGLLNLDTNSNVVGIGTTAPQAKLHVGVGNTGRALQASSAYMKGDLELDGVAYLDGNVAKFGTGGVIDDTSGTYFELAGASGDYVKIGDNATATSQGLSASNDLLVTGNLEIDGWTYLDGGVYLGDTETDNITVKGVATFQQPSAGTSIAIYKDNFGTTVMNIVNAAAMRIGKGAENHPELASTDDLFVSGDIEVDGIAYLDGAIKVVGSTKLDGVVNVGDGSGSDNVAIDTGSGTFQLASNALDIDTSGNVTNIGNVTGTAGITVASLANGDLVMNPHGSGDIVLKMDGAGSVVRSGFGSEAGAGGAVLSAPLSNQIDLYVYRNIDQTSTQGVSGGAVLKVEQNVLNKGAVASSDEVLQVIQDTDSTGNIAIFKYGGTNVLTVQASDAVRVGSGTENKTLTTRDDLFVTGNVEVDGTTYLDSKVNAAADVVIGAEAGFSETTTNPDLYVQGNIEADGSIYGNLVTPAGGRSRFVNITVTGTADLQGTIENSAGTLSFNDDAMAISKAATLDLTNSEARALNIEAGLLNLDTNSSVVGIGTTAPQAKLHVGVGNTGRALQASSAYMKGDLELDGVAYLDGNVAKFGTGGVIDDTSGTYFELAGASGDYVKIGDNATATSHPETVSASNDLLVTGDLEVDGWTYLDGGIDLGDADVDTLTVRGTGTFQQATTLTGYLDLNSYLDLDYNGTGDALNVAQAGSGNVAVFVRGSTTALTIDNSADITVGGGTFNNASTSPDVYVTGNIESDGVIYGNISASSGTTTLANLTVTGTGTFTNGPVGIATTSPGSNKLAVQGTVIVAGDVSATDADGTIYLGRDASSSHYLMWDDDYSAQDTSGWFYADKGMSVERIDVRGTSPAVISFGSGTNAKRLEYDATTQEFSFTGGKIKHSFQNIIRSGSFEGVKPTGWTDYNAGYVGIGATVANAKFGSKYLRVRDTSGVNSQGMAFIVPDSDRFKGKDMTLSLMARGDAGTTKGSVGVGFTNAVPSTGGTQSTNIPSSGNISVGWTNYTYSFSVPANAAGLTIYLYGASGGSAGAATTAGDGVGAAEIYYDGITLVEGKLAMDFGPSPILDTGDQVIYGNLAVGANSDAYGGTSAALFFGEPDSSFGTGYGGYGMGTGSIKFQQWGADGGRFQFNRGIWLDDALGGGGGGGGYGASLTIGSYTGGIYSVQRGDIFARGRLELRGHPQSGSYPSPQTTLVVGHGLTGAAVPSENINYATGLGDVYVTGSIEADGTIYGDLLAPAGGRSRFVNITVTGTADLQGTLENTDVGEALILNDDVTIGKDSASAVTLNASSITVASDTNLTLSGGLNGLSFDGTTLSIDAAGDRVGIGTAGPQQPLHVMGVNPIRIERSAVGSVDLGVDNITGTADFVVAPQTNSSGVALRYRTSGGALTTGMVLNASGNVGIGATSPNAKLVVGPDSTQPNKTVSTNSAFIVGNLEVDGTTYLDGRLGIGLSPGAWLDIGGTANVTALKVSTLSGTGAVAQFKYGNTQAFYISDAGNIGIGNEGPAEKIDITGSLKLSGRIRQGSLADIAEMMPLSQALLDAAASVAAPAAGLDLAVARAAANLPQPGDVVEVDESGAIRKSSRPNSAAVIGIVSGDPAQILREDLANGVPVALSGTVLCNVTCENGPIKPGDLLVSSSKPGYAMAAGEHPAAGTVIGKALGALEKGDGRILVLVMLR